MKNLKRILGPAVAVFLAFIGLQFIRGAQHLNSFIASLLGYSAVSYNRLAALTDGSLHGYYEGRGCYLFAYLLQNAHFAGLRHALQIPNSIQIWQSEFPAVAGAGLNPSFNWPGTFGYLFYDLGWWTPLYLFAAGLLAGWLWRGFKRGRTLGIVMYPWMAFWVLFWFGWNCLFDARAVSLGVAMVGLAVYDKVFIQRRKLWETINTR